MIAETTIRYYAMEISMSPSEFGDEGPPVLIIEGCDSGRCVMTGITSRCIFIQLIESRDECYVVYENKTMIVCKCT